MGGIVMKKGGMFRTSVRKKHKNTLYTLVPGYRSVQGYPVLIVPEKQSFFIPGRRPYEAARAKGNFRSIIYRDTKGLQKLLDEYAGTGEFVSQGKEIVDFEQVIGQYIEPVKRTRMETTIGVIHYNEEGAYIAPARPNKREVVEWMK